MISRSQAPASATCRTVFSRAYTQKPICTFSKSWKTGAALSFAFFSTRLWFPKFIIAAGYASAATLVSLEARQIQWPTLPNNLTEDVLQIASAISPPCAGINTNCQCPDACVCVELNKIPDVGAEIITQSMYASAFPPVRDWLIIFLSTVQCVWPILPTTKPHRHRLRRPQLAIMSYINSTDTMSPTSPVSPTASAADGSSNESKVLVGPIVGGGE
ncbi:hypothetical protein AG1IA_00885 [Rhizoctonia solani AG-1 IA]|uniref:Uncharacterized protein n=1 Tax=Thanatephorus cucumeris (strain AG1-IA) TaxID=983506 RepID=L8X8V6_THACA|nr:hypothetical protein AG1IA_00885 [Rhizoctonia solani AG-1 IA]